MKSTNIVIPLPFSRIFVSLRIYCKLLLVVLSVHISVDISLVHVSSRNLYFVVGFLPKDVSFFMSNLSCLKRFDFIPCICPTVKRVCRLHEMALFSIMPKKIASILKSWKSRKKYPFLCGSLDDEVS